MSKITLRRLSSWLSQGERPRYWCATKENEAISNVLIHYEDFGAFVWC